MSRASHIIESVVLAAALATAQMFAPTGSLRFEVASIKPTQPGAPKGGLRPAPGGGRYIGSNLSLRLYLVGAYQVKFEQITGGPGWVDNDPYDLNAQAERPSSLEELHIMLQNLLTERFKLQFHGVMKEMPAYVLTLGKGGPKNMRIHPITSAGDVILDQATEHVARAK